MILAWLIVAALSVVIAAHGWMLRHGLDGLSAQLATLTLAIREIHDQIAALDQELHAVDADLKQK